MRRFAQEKAKASARAKTALWKEQSPGYWRKAKRWVWHHKACCKMCRFEKIFSRPTRHEKLAKLKEKEWNEESYDSQED
jgi:hypothetical protein